MLAVEDSKTTTPVALEALDAPYHIGAVSLRVHDLSGLTAFYRDGIGLGFLPVIEARLLKRWQGMADGPAKVAENDLPNARIVAERSRPADLVLNGAG